MTPLSTSLHDVEPIRLRGLAFLSLSDVGEVLPRTMIDNQGGGQSETYGTAGTLGTAGSVVPCRVDPVGGQETVTAGRIDERTTHSIYVPAGTRVFARDRFRVTTGTFTAGTYEIVAVRSRTQQQVRILEAVEDF